MNYNSISEQQLIILNELENIPNVLQTTLVQFLENGGHVLIIPHQKLGINSYNGFFGKIIQNGNFARNYVWKSFKSIKFYFWIQIII